MGYQCFLSDVKKYLPKKFASEAHEIKHSSELTWAHEPGWARPSSLNLHKLEISPEYLLPNPTKQFAICKIQQVSTLLSMPQTCFYAFCLFL